MKINKKLLTFTLGTLFIFWIMFSLYLNTIWFKIEDLGKYAWENTYIIILGALFIFSIRLFLFIPSNVLVISLWTVTNNIWLTFFISIFWIFISVMQNYYIWLLINDDLKWNKFLEKIEPYSIKIKKRWFIYIFIWTLIPFFPSDLVYTAAWFERYNLYKFMIASFLWIIPVTFLYSYLWSSSNEYMEIVKYIFAIIFIILILFFIFKKWFKKIKGE